MRKERFVTIIDDGKEILFKVKQMPAVKQERWINKLILLLLGGGGINKIEFDKLMAKFENGQWDDLLLLFGSLKYKDVEPLYDELLECVEHVPDARDRKFTVPQSSATIDSIIGEVKNLYKLRLESLKVNFDFFKDGETSPIKNEPGITISRTM